MKALVIDYFPLISGTQNVDPVETSVSCPNGQVANNSSGPPCTLAFMRSYVAGITSPSHCGSVHNPPNAAFEHDYGDTIANSSDCQNFYTSGLFDSISCQNWNSCTGNLDTDEPHYLVWWMQNFPGLPGQAHAQLVGRARRLGPIHMERQVTGELTKS